MELNFFSAFIIGLLGGGHCIAMCGGITTMLTSALPKQRKNNLPYILTYNIGRILSYTFIGAIAGFSGSLAIKSLGFPVIMLKMVAGLFLILLGLYIGQWLMWLTKVEVIGKHIWKVISPFSKKLIPVNTIKKSFFLGVLWGWLPCGLVYSTLTWSLASGSALNGGLIMMFFGLGTLPALLTVSFGFEQIKSLIQQTIFKRIMALLLIVYGLYTLMIAYQLMI
ncbi:sulfite exporter TauE/SafE family protein [Colwellia sp. 1_MG-2023]|uniref:sulfite exporter TauE/SafE family protein n=1 Tax=Colwellia sp. 1_MG-2023 TaxID=3062649 RepID=UPI0026E46267|nr:sulfite exporter TauE/SafE family protein [Colwellia sp. 1_MG-2023]MDO6447290.1 sulfite exporter TauE/SafE family protein [Colwellia sp. 1_MG-2023]